MKRAQGTAQRRAGSGCCPSSSSISSGRGSGATEVNLLWQSLFPHVAALMHSCTLHSPRNISVLFNQPCLQGSTVLEHRSDMHIQQRMCPAVQSCWLQKKSRKTRTAEVQQAQYSNPSLISPPSLCPVGNTFLYLRYRYT